jgi:hypothetical protein
VKNVNLCGRSIAALMMVVVLPTAAQAHVKWFCAYDVAGAPRGLEQVLCAQFEWLTCIALLCLTIGTLIERTQIGQISIIGLDYLTRWPRANTEKLVRGVGGAFFVALWAMGGTILTPELKTTEAWIPWFQLGMAACFLWRETLPLAGLGIVLLFGIGVRDYGVFHLADYPVFLGVATFLILAGLQKSFFGLRPLDLVRITAAITLMWASVEKWAYPQWTDPLLAAKPEMTMGFSSDLFMDAAGVIEFTLAFGLIWTQMVRRYSAAILVFIFVSAIFGFGKIDAIGHSPIIVVLVAFVADDHVMKISGVPSAFLRRVLAPFERTRYLGLATPAFYMIALALFLTAYYGGHEAIYPETAGGFIDAKAIPASAFGPASGYAQAR